MGLKEIKLGGQSTLTGLVVVMLLAIGIFGGMFMYFQGMMLDHGQNVPEKYNRTFTHLTESAAAIEGNVHTIQDSLYNVQEADSIYFAAWNGLKGLGAALKLPFKFIESGFLVATSTITAPEVVPPFYQGLALTGILGSIVFLAFAILKGEPRM